MHYLADVAWQLLAVTPTSTSSPTPSPTGSASHDIAHGIATWGPRVAEQVRLWLPALGAVVAAIFAVSAWKREKRRDDDRYADKAREQATKIAAWLTVESNVGKVIFMDESRPVPDPRTWKLIITNPTDVPIYNLEPSVHYAASGELVGSLVRRPAVLPGDPTTIQLAKNSRERLDVGVSMSATDEEVAQHVAKRQAAGTSVIKAIDYRVAITFTDAAGVDWARDHNGVLTRVEVPTDIRRRRREAASPGDDPSL